MFSHETFARTQRAGGSPRGSRYLVAWHLVAGHLVARYFVKSPASFLCILSAALSLAGCTGTAGLPRSGSYNPPATATVAVSVMPSSASVQTGGSQQFSASVTGTTNTGVTWSATGGTISSTGLFIAGATAGAYGVTATSMADSAKSAQVP